MIAATLAIYAWLLSNAGYDTFSRIPPLFVPGVQMMLLGLALIPGFLLPAFLVMVILVLRGEKRPHTSLVFLGIQFVILVANISHMGNGMRYQLALILASSALVAEVGYRQLAMSQRIVAGLSVLVTIVWYVVIACACESAAV